MFKKYFNFQMAISYIFQAVFTAICPPAILLFLTIWLRDKYALGNWIVIVGVSLGTIIGVYSMIAYVIKMTKVIEEKEKRKENNTNSEPKE